MPQQAPFLGKVPFECTQRDRIVSFLENDYAEKLTSFAPDSRGWIIEKWVGPAGSWTLLETRPDAISCVIATGSGWIKTTDAQ